MRRLVVLLARKPPISATVRDATTDLAKGDIQLSVDGRSVGTFSYDGARDKVSYTTSRDLSFWQAHREGSGY